MNTDRMLERQAVEHFRKSSVETAHEKHAFNESTRHSTSIPKVTLHKNIC